MDNQALAILTAVALLGALVIGIIASTDLVQLDGRQQAGFMPVSIHAPGSL